MEKAYLMLGSNIGDRKRHLMLAMAQIEKSAGHIAACSSAFKTAAWGNELQDDFYNQAVIVETLLSPYELLHTVLKIEETMGRTRKEKWEPRVIDIDIIFFGNQVITGNQLRIPHAHVASRRFVLLPLAEIAPEFLHPVLGKTIVQMLRDCPDTLEAVKLS